MQNKDCNHFSASFKVPVFLAVLIFRLAAQGTTTFPQTCPTDDLKKTCESLGSIKNNQVVVFADGTEMSACFIHTANPKEADEIAVRKSKLYRKVVHRLRELTDENTVNLIMGTHFEPSRLLVSIPPGDEAHAAVLELIEISEQIRPPRRRVAKNIDAEVEFAKNEISGLLKRAQFGNPQINEHQITIFNQIVNRTHPSIRPITCRPTLNAFYLSDNDRRAQLFSASPAVTNLPPFAKMRIIGHELAHAIDPCQKDFEKSPAFENLVSCLQDDVGYFMADSSRGKCDPHTREAFSDAIGVWLAEKWHKAQPKPAPIVKDNSPQKVYLPPGFEMIIFDLDMACGELMHNRPSGDHPKSRNRLKNIVLKNPLVAKTLNCRLDAKTPRCDVEAGLQGEKPGMVKKFLEQLTDKVNGTR